MLKNIAELELPAGFAQATLPHDGRILYSPDATHLAAPLEARQRWGAGIWTYQGELVKWFGGYCQLAWTAKGLALVRLDESEPFHLIVELLDWPSLDVWSVWSRPRPAAGIGGFVIEVSPRSSYLAVMLYSGQSEQGYELLSLSPTLQRVGSLGYVVGTSDLTPMAFSPDESLVALALLEEPIWWADLDDDDRDWDTPASGGSVAWANIYVHRIGEEEPTRYTLKVEVPAGWVPPASVAEDSCPRNLRFAGPSEVCFELPWGGTQQLSLGSARELRVSSVLT